MQRVFILFCLVLFCLPSSAQMSPVGGNPFEDYIIESSGDTLHGRILKRSNRKLEFRSVDGREMKLGPWDIRGFFDHARNLYTESKLDNKSNKMLFVVPIITSFCSYYLWTDGYVSNKDDNFRVFDAEVVRYFAEPPGREMFELKTRKSYKSLLETLKSCEAFAIEFEVLKNKVNSPYANDRPDQSNVFNFYYDLIDLFNKNDCG